MHGSNQPAAGADLMAQPVVRSRHRLQPPIPVCPHVYPPESPAPETQHPCGFPADLPEQVQNIECPCWRRQASARSATDATRCLGSWLGISVLRLPAHPRSSSSSRRSCRSCSPIGAMTRSSSTSTCSRASCASCASCASREWRACVPPAATVDVWRRSFPLAPCTLVETGQRIRCGAAWAPDLRLPSPGNRAPTTRSGSIRNVSAHSDDTSVSRPRVGLRSRPS
jgi:hypothetical protein